MKRHLFQGICSVVKRFLPNFARFVAPLTKTLMKNQPKSFGLLHKEELNAIEALKESLIGPPVSDLAKNDGNYTLVPDACDKQIGCLFLQDR